MSPPQALRIICPNLTCRSLLSVPANARGKVVRCRQCGTNIKIPQAAKTSTEGEEQKKSA